MRSLSCWFSTLAVIAVSGLGLVACGLDTTEPPDPPTIHHYRVQAIDLPVTSDQVRAFAFDLDGDRAPDNKLGSAYSALVGVDSYYQVEAPAAVRLASDVPWIVSIYDYGPARGAVRIARGVEVDGVLQPVDEVLPSTGNGLGPDDELTGGAAMFPLGAISDGLGTADPDWVETELTHVVVESFDQTSAAIRVGVALAEADVLRVIAENLAEFFSDRLANGQSEYARDYLDANQDGVITVAEVRDNPLVQNLLSPDLYAGSLTELDRDSVSFGVRLIATAL